MATTKTVNYTAEQTVEMVRDYTANPTSETVAVIAEKLGKTVRSVVAKLSREGVYKAKEYTRKDGKAVEKKDDTAQAIGNILGLSEGEITSLAKANRTALQKVFNALANSKPIDG